MGRKARLISVLNEAGFKNCKVVKKNAIIWLLKQEKIRNYVFTVPVGWTLMTSFGSTLTSMSSGLFGQIAFNR